jgi:hypothetical protein
MVDFGTECVNNYLYHAVFFFFAVPLVKHFARRRNIKFFYYSLQQTVKCIWKIFPKRRNIRIILQEFRSYSNISRVKSSAFIKRSTSNVYFSTNSPT